MSKKQFKDMTPTEIRVALLRKNVALSGIGRDLEIHVSSIWRVIEGRSVSHRIRQAISEATGIPLTKMWPSTYLTENGPRKPGRPVGSGFKKAAA